MTHMYFSARAEGRISYGHLGPTNSCLIKLGESSVNVLRFLFLSLQGRIPLIFFSGGVRYPFHFLGSACMILVSFPRLFPGPHPAVDDIYFHQGGNVFISFVCLSVSRTTQKTT